jgi:hypothetical protein
MKNIQKLQRLLQIAAVNGWKLPEYYQWDRISSKFEIVLKDCIIHNNETYEDHWFCSLNDLVLNFEEGEISFLEALSGNESNSIISQWCKLPTTKRVDWLFTTFNHLTTSIQMFKLNQLATTIVALISLSSKINCVEVILNRVLDLLDVSTSSHENLTFDTVEEIVRTNRHDNKVSVLDYLNNLDLSTLRNDVTTLLDEYHRMLLANYPEDSYARNSDSFITFESFKDFESNRYEEEEMPNDIILANLYYYWFTSK